jgi:DNA-binding MarR family transcriptional regulator
MDSKQDNKPDHHPILRFDGCIATNIEEAYRHLEQVYERLIAPLGLSILEWYALRALYANDGLSASHLAALVCRHPSSMTALLDRMEEKGLLRREVDPDDRRSVRIFLCDAGRVYRPQVEAVAHQLDRLVSTHITPQQMKTFHYVLSVLQHVGVDDTV